MDPTGNVVAAGECCVCSLPTPAHHSQRRTGSWALQTVYTLSTGSQIGLHPSLHPHGAQDCCSTSERTRLLQQDPWT
jgi:hypothetical protein